MSILYIVVSFVFNSFPLLVALVSLSFGGVMLIDSMVHDHITYKRYDAFFWICQVMFLRPDSEWRACAHGITIPD